LYAIRNIGRAPAPEPNVSWERRQPTYWRPQALDERTIELRRFQNSAGSSAPQRSHEIMNGAGYRVVAIRVHPIVVGEIRRVLISFIQS
jgi:hypothetical protein